MTSITPAVTGSSTVISPSSSSASSDLVTSTGKTSISDSVVQKIAGIAARQVSGVHNLGGGAARTFGSIKERLPGTSGPSTTQGVSVEVGERQAAVDLELVAEYGVSIPDLAQSVRRNVINSVERMTGLEVTEVNVSVDDIYMTSDDDSDSEPNSSRVQ